MPNVRAQLGDAISSRRAYAAADGADALVLVTEWHELPRPRLRRASARMRAPVLFDGRNVWDPDEPRALGFTYYGIGRP